MLAFFLCDFAKISDIELPATTVILKVLKYFIGFVYERGMKVTTQGLQPLTVYYVMVIKDGALYAAEVLQEEHL